jgi:cobalamin biosynthetic protein CobC
LPDEAELAKLEKAAALAFGAPAGLTCALPGTEIGIRLLATMNLPGPVRIVEPCYGSYREAWPEATGIDESQLAEEGPQTLVVANPNNPDGKVRPAEELLGLAERLERTGGFLVVDEAFVDSAPELSLCPALSDRKNIAVLRSFGKFFGLGGIRLGFLASSAELIEAARKRVGAWPVSTAALRVGTAAYADRAWADQTRACLTVAAARLDEVLIAHGLSVRGDCPLFRLVESEDAPKLFTRLARRGILTRPFSFNPRWLRIGLPADEAARNRFKLALSAALEDR